MRWVALLALLVACDDGSSTASDVGVADISVARDMLLDGAPADLRVVPDGAMDVGPDARPDVPPDAAPDWHWDLSPDGPSDAAADGPVDAAGDGLPDVNLDGPPDASGDGPADVALDAADIEVDASPVHFDARLDPPDMAPVPDLGPDAAQLGPCGEVPEGLACIPPGVFVMGSDFEEARAGSSGAARASPTP